MLFLHFIDNCFNFSPTKVAQAIVMCGSQAAKNCRQNLPLLFTWHDKQYYGAAHGYAGIIYLLLKVLVNSDKKNFAVEYYISVAQIILKANLKTGHSQIYFGFIGLRIVLYYVVGNEINY